MKYTFLSCELLPEETFVYDYINVVTLSAEDRIICINGEREFDDDDKKFIRILNILDYKSIDFQCRI